MALSRGSMIKLLELAVVCVIIGLHYYSFSDGGIANSMLFMGTFGGYLIILAGICLGIVFSFGVDRRLDMFFSIVGCILFILAGAMIINHFANGRGSFHDTGIAKGCVSLFQGILFLLDAFFVYRREA